MKKIIFALAVLALSSCAPQFVILHTNDTHSHVEAMRSGRRTGDGGVIERAAILDSVRNARGENRVLLLHAGDFNQGTSYFSTLGGSLEVDLVNAMRYDAITLGNHEFDNGIEDLAARLSRLNCPVVCANVRFEGTPLEPYVKPYVIIRKAGRKIGIVGATSNLAHNVSYEISSRLLQYDNADSINKWTSYLKKVEKCDMVIFLSHLGYREDLEIVPMLSGVDLVIGGHSHTFVDDLKYVVNADGKKTPVIQDGCWGYEWGEILVK